MLCSIESIDKKKKQNINNVIEVMTCVRIGEGSRLEYIEVATLRMRIARLGWEG